MAGIFKRSNGTLPHINNATDMINAIKSALITGYANLASAGWQMLYDSNNDSSASVRRIVVCSNSASSEQKIYEFIDSVDRVTVTAYQDFVDGVGVNVWHSCCLFIATTDADFIVVADDRFVWISSFGVSMFFGDIDTYHVNSEQSIMFGPVTNNTHYNNVCIPSTKNPNNPPIVCSDGTRIVCRSLNVNERYGFGSRVNESGDWTNHILLEQDNIQIYSVELLAIHSSSNKYFNFGILPFLHYCDVVLSDRNVTVDGVEKTILHPLMYYVHTELVV